MVAFDSLVVGFSVALQPINLLYCFIGCFIGTLVGVLPGLGSTAAMALMIPATYNASPVAAVIVLAGVWYGSQYGGSTTAILLNIPGEAGAIMSTLDGHQMARHGRAGPALGMAAFGSFIAGTLAVMGLTFLARPLVTLALRFGPAEYFSLMFLGMVLLTFLTSGSMIKALMMICFGIIVGASGLDAMSGSARFTFGLVELMDGVGIVPLVMGLFGIAEILVNIEQEIKSTILETSMQGILPTLQDWIRVKWTILRATVIGFFIGILPGGGAILSTFAAYTVEKMLSKHPELFGTGVIEGVAAPESANNAAAQAGFIPLLTLGIPSSVIMAIILGAFMIHGVTPGPLLLVNHPDIFWGIITSMYVGNGMLLILNLPLIGLWVKVLKVPFHILMPILFLVCLIGCYSLNTSKADVLIMLIFGGIGYFLKKLKYEIAPMVLAFILGTQMEFFLKQALMSSQGDFMIFVMHPIAAICLTIALILLCLPLLPQLARRRSKLISEESST